jgi:hypothetical protein
VKLGGPKLAQARKAAVAAIVVNASRGQVLPISGEIQRAGSKSLRVIAEALNPFGIATARGGAGKLIRQSPMSWRGRAKAMPELVPAWAAVS